jgi:hypothetical protein
MVRPETIPFTVLPPDTTADPENETEMVTATTRHGISQSRKRGNLS